MLTTIQDTVLQLLPGRRRRSPGGWISFNAPCCQHRGHKADSRGRGGVIANVDGGVSYHCFNCNFKTSYKPGRHLGYKFRKLLEWLGADENSVRWLVIEAVRLKEFAKVDEVERELIEFRVRSLPDDVELVQTDSEAYAYCEQRHINLDRYPLLVSKKLEHNLNRRIIIPFTWNNQLIGYTGRAWNNLVKPKYYSQFESNYVFNIDQQLPTSKFVIVAEGPFDAMSVDGVAVLGNECSETQADIIDSLSREVILVPDRDRAGNKLIDNAIEYSWTVSFPVWYETCKDINEAVVRYGKLFVVRSILEAKQTSRLKIELMRKRLYN